MKTKNNLIYSLIITFAIATITIGYAAKTQELYIDDLKVTYREKADIRIIDVTVKELANATYSDLEYNKYNLLSSVTLDNATSYIIYNIEISNLGNVDMGIYDILNKNANLNYQFLNYNLKDPICNSNNVCNNGITKKLELKVSYKNYDKNNINYNINLKFDLRTYNTIKLVNFTSKTIDKIINGDTYIIDLSNEEVGTLIIKDTSDNLITDYTYENNVLTINSVNKDIIITNNIPRKINVTYTSYNTIGSDICIEEDCFYVIDYDEDDNKISLLTKYNISDLGQVEDINLYSFYDSLENPLQKGEDIYATNSNLYNLVEEYVKYFYNEYDILPSGSLLTLDQYNNIIAEDNDFEWLYSYNYWLGTAYDENSIYSVSVNKELIDTIYSNEISLRPILTFNIDDLIKVE